MEEPQNKIEVLKETPYKVIKYLVRLNKLKISSVKYEGDPLIKCLCNNNFISEPTDFKGKFKICADFKSVYEKIIFPLFSKYNSLIEKHNLGHLENHFTLQILEQLNNLADDKNKVIFENLSFRQIHAKYLHTIKYLYLNNPLARAIKLILGIEKFADDNSDNLLRILFPKKQTRLIVLCQNKNRIGDSTNEFIQYWHTPDIKVLSKIQKPVHPVFYLFSWDFEGLSRYAEIKSKYLPSILAFIPLNYTSIIEGHEINSCHWRNKKFIKQLNPHEKQVVNMLMNVNTFIDEQEIQLSDENIIKNLNLVDSELYPFFLPQQMSIVS